MLWHQLQPSQQVELLRLMQMQQDNPTSATPMTVDADREPTLSTTEGADCEPTPSDKSKGKSKVCVLSVCMHNYP